MAMPPAPVRVPGHMPFALSTTSDKSVANDKGDNKMILGAVREFISKVCNTLYVYVTLIGKLFTNCIGQERNFTDI